MQKIYLIRHGTTIENEDRRYCGSSEGELSTRGRNEVESLAKRLRSIAITSIYSSPRSRTRQTAMAIADYHKLVPREIPALSEIDFGLWEGLTFQDIQTNYPEELDRWIAEGDAFTFPEGENINGFQKRIIVGLTDVLADNADMAIVAHGGSLRVILCHLCGWGMDCLHSFELGPASITILARYDQSTVVQVLNDRCHLDEGDWNL